MQAYLDIRDMSQIPVHCHDVDLRMHVQRGGTYDCVQLVMEPHQASSY